MDFLLASWTILVLVFFGVPFMYNSYMKRRAAKPWNLVIDNSYRPRLSILVPAHNEEKTVGLKLENLLRVEYPSEKTEIILIDDASADKTLDEIREFTSSHSSRDIKVLNTAKRLGKPRVLNLALKHVTGDVVVVSDADCFLSLDVFNKAIPYLADSNVGAVAGREVLLNPQSSWVTKSEVFFSDFVQPQRLGESKVHSTVFFQGGFAAYKRACISEFDEENDDSGTALNIVQRKSRTIVIPEARFYTIFPSSWKNKVSLKMRRANHQQRIWLRCLKLLLGRRLVLPKKIAIPEIYLQILSPLIFLTLSVLSAFLALERPTFALTLVTILALIFCIPRARIAMIEIGQNYFILLAALTWFATRRHLIAWKTESESRLALDENILREYGLIGTSRQND